MFSARLAWDRPENELARAGAEGRALAGDRFIDLTESNPTCVGLAYPAEVVAALADPRGVRYEPAPRGLAGARAAVSADYARRGAVVEPGDIVLSASSSDSYAMLFKLLCDPGDAVLVPEPSYPLFEYLARLEGVSPSSYRLAFDGAWHVDWASFEDALAGVSRPRAVVVVNPNNPTGSFLTREDWQHLAASCAARDLAVIADEVFADYERGVPHRVRTVAAEPDPALTFSLGGLSKACGLPQMKLGWIAATGPRVLVDRALARLELISDTYLSVASAVQLALPRLLELGAAIRGRIAGRVAGNLAVLAGALGPSSPLTLLPAEGGWSAILRVPATRPDHEWATVLARDDAVLVHPGYFFDMPPGAYLIVSLLPPPERFGDGVRRLVGRVR